MACDEAPLSDYPGRREDVIEGGQRNDRERI